MRHLAVWDLEVWSSWVWGVGVWGLGFRVGLVPGQGEGEVKSLIDVLKATAARVFSVGQLVHPFQSHLPQ